MRSFSIAVVICGLAFAARAETFVLHNFEKIKLENTFYSEGANFGDVNNDGIKDVVSGPYWYIGPDFKQRIEIYPPVAYKKENYSENFFSWAYDLTKDGYDDVVIVGFPGKEGIWYENPKGNGPWKKHVAIDIVDNESPAFTDLTGDGIPEFVCSQKGQYGYASVNATDPRAPWTFIPISERSDYQRFTHGMGVGDVNNDGKLDLLAKDGFWIQPADLKDKPLWKKHAFNFSGPGGSQMYAYDFDGDGDNDVLTSLAAHGYGIVWYEQVEKDGKVDFLPHRIIGENADQNEYGVVFSQPHAIDLVDMDRDGLKDIVVGKRHWAHGPKGDPEPNNPAVLYWLKTVRDKGKTSFIPYLIDSDTGVGTQVVAGDLNGDKLPDIVVGNKLGTTVLIHKTRSVSRDEWEKSQPKLKSKSSVAQAEVKKN